VTTTCAKGTEASDADGHGCSCADGGISGTGGSSFDAKCSTLKAYTMCQKGALGDTLKFNVNDGGATSDPALALYEGQVPLVCTTGVPATVDVNAKISNKLWWMHAR
jgi:hypothetical protein